MKSILTLVLTLFTVASFAQKLYRDPVFADVEQTTHTFTSKGGTRLAFDFYRANKATEPLPLVVYVHGGGFSGGTRNSEDIVLFAEQLAQRGYGVASVDYRLTMTDRGFGCEVPAREKVAAFEEAAYDVSLALQMILAQNDQFHINTKKIILMGSSAGAETVLHMAFVYQNPVLSHDTKYAGVISLAGAMISTDTLSMDRAVPSLFFHGTGDPLVPYGVAPHHYCGEDAPGYLMLYGPAPIAQRIKGLKTSYYLYSVDGGSHDWAGIPMAQNLDEILDFLHHDVLYPKGTRQTDRRISP